MLRETYNSNELDEFQAGYTDQLPGGRQWFAQHVSHITQAQQVSTDYIQFDMEVHLFISKYDILLTFVTLGEW